MLEELFTEIVHFSEQFIVPDWGALISLIPIGLAGLVLLYLARTVYTFATAAPTRRGIRRLEPVAPPDIHMPGPSFAPFLAAFGAFMLVFGLIAGGLWTWVGLIVLVITLLYWGREALRDYDHIPGVAQDVETLPVVAHPGPPPGVHMPPPSFRPLTISIGMAILVAGMVIGGWALILGLAAIVVTGLDWLRDARKEYTATEEADRTGHLDLGGSPAWPTGTFAALAVIIVLAAVLSSGIIPGGDTTGGEAVPSAGTGGEPGGGGTAGGGEPTAGPQLPEGDVVIEALNVEFLQSSVTAPAGRDFTIVFDNQDAGVPHNVEIKDGDAIPFLGDVFPGPEVRVYQVPALAAGTYTFICTVHPNMQGTLTAQ